MRWSGLSLLAVTLLPMAAGAGLAFILGIFQELVDSTDSSNFFEEISSAAPARPLQRFANPALLAVSFFLGALHRLVRLRQGLPGPLDGRTLPLTALLLLIGTPIADSLRLLRASPSRGPRRQGRHLPGKRPMHSTWWASYRPWTTRVSQVDP